MEGKVPTSRSRCDGFILCPAQVLSPLSDSILAEKTVTVLDDKVSVTDLAVQFVAGLSVTLHPSTEDSEAVTAVTTAEELLRTPKQVGAWTPEAEGGKAGCHTCFSQRGGRWEERGQGAQPTFQGGVMWAV